MRVLLLGIATAALATPVVAARTYVPVPLSGGEVIITQAGRFALSDWTISAADPAILLVHDEEQHWYRVQVSGRENCRFEGQRPVGTYGAFLAEGAFGQGAWVQNSVYPYQRCLVRSVKLAPGDQNGVPKSEN